MTSFPDQACRFRDGRNAEGRNFPGWGGFGMRLLRDGLGLYRSLFKVASKTLICQVSFGVSLVSVRFQLFAHLACGTRQKWF